MEEIIKNRVGIVVVNLNQLQLTKKCIDDLLNQINENFDIFLYDQNSNEEGTAKYLRNCENNNINVLRNNENIPLNHIWNNFKNICSCEYLCFLNNDTELSNMFIDDIINVFGLEPKVGFVIHVTNHPQYLETKKKLEYKILNPAYYQGWDFTIRRNLIPEIPKVLIIFGGDDYIFAKAVNAGYNVALVYSSPIIHYSSKTRATISNIQEIQNNDAKNFYQILGNENLRQINITTNVGLCKTCPEPDMKIKQLPTMSKLFYNKEFEFYFNKIKNNEHFKYSRYNDGELIAIIGKTPLDVNCDGHQYFPEMSVELKNILLNYKCADDYVLESFDYWYSLLPHVKEILNELKLINPELTFLHTDFIRISHEQNPEDFFQLLEVLKTKKLVIIGPQYLTKLSKFFSFTHIEIPIKNCYLAKNEIIKKITGINKTTDNNYYLFSASMPTKVIIDAFKDDNKNTYLDWGSVWDTFFVSPEYDFIRKRSTSNFDKYKEIYKEYLI